jgi:hypothetical protein
MKKSKSLNDVDAIMNTFSQLMNGNYLSTFGSMFKMPVNPIELGILSEEIYLIDIDVPENKERFKLKYGNLYEKDEAGEVYLINNVEVRLKKINDNIFRVGGMSIGFKKNPYCELIHYEFVSNKEHSCLGNHCLIDRVGKIVFEADSPIKYPYYHKGCIVKYEQLYINLKTGLPIVSGYNSVASENYLFVECSCYNNEFPKGVYKIEYSTGNFEVIN